MYETLVIMIVLLTILWNEIVAIQIERLVLGLDKIHA